MEARVSGRGHGATIIVGLPDRSVNEARERVRAGVMASELWWPKGRVIVNLAPGNVPKLGSAPRSRDRSRDPRRQRSAAARSLRTRARARRARVRRPPAAGARRPDRRRDGAPRRARGPDLPERVRGRGCARGGHPRAWRAAPHGGRRVAQRRARAAGRDARPDRRSRPTAPIWPTCAGSRWPAALSSSPPSAATTSSWWARRASARRCSRGASRACCRRSTTRRRSRSRACTPRPACCGRARARSAARRSARRTTAHPRRRSWAAGRARGRARSRSRPAACSSSTS